MHSKKAERFERHRKEIRKKAFLNVSIVLLAVTGLGFYVGGYMLEFFSLVFSTGIAVPFSMVFVGSLILIWSIPLFHYKERVELRSDEDKEYYTERDEKDIPLVKMLEKKGWEDIESTHEKVVLETYPTYFHRVLGKKTSLTLEEEESTEDYDITVLKSGEKEVSRIKTEYEQDDQGLKVVETTVSRSRVSPVYIEVTMYLMPELHELTEDVEQGDIEIVEDDIDYSFGQYDLE